MKKLLIAALLFIAQGVFSQDINLWQAQQFNAPTKPVKATDGAQFQDSTVVNGLFFLTNLLVLTDTTANKPLVINTTTRRIGRMANWPRTSGSGGGGSVTAVSSGNLAPLFTVAVTNPTTTPAFAFTLSNAVPFTVFGRASGTGVPSFLQWDTTFNANNWREVRSLFSAIAPLSYDNITGEFSLVPAADDLAGVAGQVAYFDLSNHAISNGNFLWNDIDYIFTVGDPLGSNNHTSFMVDDLNSKIRLNATIGFGASIELNSTAVHLPFLSPSAFVFTDASRNLVSVASPLAATLGGTSNAVYALGDILYANTTTSLARRADIATGNALISGGVGVAPLYGKIGLTTHVSGILPYANGGTNSSIAFTLGSVIVAGATGFVQDNSGFFYDVTNHWLGLGLTVPLYPVHIKGTANKGLAIDNAGSGSLQLFVGNGSGGYTSGANYIVSSGTDLYFKTVSAVEQVHMNASGINFFDATAIAGPILTSGIRTDIHANGGSLSANNALIQLHTDNAADAVITLRTTGTNEKAAIFVKHSTQDFHVASVFHDIIFDTGLAGDSERVRIMYNGNVGIGTSAPVRTFSTIGRHRYRGLDSLATVDTTGGQFLKINRNGDVFMSITGGGGSGAPVYVSDEIPYGDGTTPGGVTDPNFKRNISLQLFSVTGDDGAGTTSNFTQVARGNNLVTTDASNNNSTIATGVGGVIDLTSSDNGVANTTNLNLTPSVFSASYTDGSTNAYINLYTTKSTLIYGGTVNTAAGISANNSDLEIINYNYVWTWPTADGTAGQVMTTNGSGRITFTTPSGFANTALSNLASVSINTSLLAQTGVDLGSTTKPFRDLYLFGSGTYATTYLKITGTPTSTRTLTLPDATTTILANNVGITGGTTLVGGTASGDDITLSSTSNGTKGNIFFGTSTYDEVNNRLGIGTMTPSLDMSIVKSGATAQFNMISYNTTGSNRSICFFQTATGTVGSPGNVAASDQLGEFIFSGYAGSAFRNVGGFNARVPASPGTISATNMPCELYWEVTPLSSIVRAEKMRLSSEGRLYVGGAALATGILHIAAGSATASTAPFKLTTGTVNTTAEAGALEYSTPTLSFTNGGAQRQEIPLIQQTRVSTQFDKTSSTALANVTGLTATLVAGKKYRFEAELYTTSNVAGGVQAAIAGTCTATAIVYEGLTYNAGVITQTRGTALATAVGAVTAVTAAYIHIVGLITVNAAGTLTVQFAQNASSGTASSVLVGSTFVTTEIN